MDIIESINERKSIRAFKSDPIPFGTLKEIMELAVKAPSASNTQSWEFAIVTGGQLEEIKRRLVEKAEEASKPDMGPPREFPEPYGSRRQAMAAKMYPVKGIRKEDTEKRGWWRLEGLKSFGAPCVIYIYTDRSFLFRPEGTNMVAIYNCGLVAENIMLLAPNYGLGTICQGGPVSRPEALKEVLGIPDSKFFVIAIAIGYPDKEDPINQLQSERVPLGEVAKWYGFNQ